jgi:hypothetical protein
MPQDSKTGCFAWLADHSAWFDKLTMREVSALQGDTDN